MATLLGEFTAKDAAGNEYTIQIWRSTHPGGTTGKGRGISLPSLIDLRTKDGVTVNRMGSGRYEILTANGPVEVTSSAPNAP